MVTRWGMSDKLGMVQLAPRENRFLGGGMGLGEGRPFGEETARLVDEEVRRIVEDCHAEAKRLLVEHRPALDALVQALLERETLDEQEILRVTGVTPPGEPDNRPLPQRGADTPERAAAP
jgi:cell division protease FtsH